MFPLVAVIIIYDHWTYLKFCINSSWIPELIISLIWPSKLFCSKTTSGVYFYMVWIILGWSFAKLLFVPIAIPRWLPLHVIVSLRTLWENGSCIVWKLLSSLKFDNLWKILALWFSMYVTENRRWPKPKDKVLTYDL